MPAARNPAAVQECFFLAFTGQIKNRLKLNRNNQNRFENHIKMRNDAIFVFLPIFAGTIKQQAFQPVIFGSKGILNISMIYILYIGNSKTWFQSFTTQQWRWNVFFGAKTLQRTNMNVNGFFFLFSCSMFFFS